MAKRKKSRGANQAIASPVGGRHISTSIDEVDNGFVVNVSGEGKNGEYSSKRMIAGDKPAALRIANDFLSGGGRSKGRSKKKGNNKKKISVKRG
jgi:hypothetical protein